MNRRDLFKAALGLLAAPLIPLSTPTEEYFPPSLLSEAQEFEFVQSFGPGHVDAELTKISCAYSDVSKEFLETRMREFESVLGNDL